MNEENEVLTIENIDKGIKLYKEMVYDKSVALGITGGLLVLLAQIFPTLGYRATIYGATASTLAIRFFKDILPNIKKLKKLKETRKSKEEEDIVHIK